MKAHHRSHRSPGLGVAVLVGALVVMLGACTDLTETTFSEVTPDAFYKTEGEVIAAMAPVYAQLRSAVSDNYFALSEITTDEALIPARGQDWYDNGAHLALKRHTWDAAHGEINGAWNNAYTGVARANVVLQTLDQSDLPGKEQVQAELRALRAFYYYQLMDLFGGVPIIGDDEWVIDPDNLPARNTRQEVFNFIESELLAVRDQLPPEWPSSGYGRMTRGAANAILASLYLNAAEWSGTPQWQKAIDAADAVIAGPYQLEQNWNAIFAYDNNANKEHIFVAPFLPVEGMGHSFIFRSLHYSQYNPSPWNGWATSSDTWNSFDTDDGRRSMFLEGPQFNVENGQPVNNRQGERLIFTASIANIENATEGEGIRFYKYPWDPNHQGYNNGNDVPIFRLTEMYMIKAEALVRLGRPGEALPLVNMIRARVFEPDEPLATVTEADILRERLFEFAFEGKRRQDLIRFGIFNDPVQYRPTASPSTRKLFPIPTSQLDANDKLVQNEGY